MLERRFFPAVVLTLLAVAGYFQARGIGHLVAAWVTEPTPRPVAASLPRPFLAPRVDDKDGALAILSRNPFDSVTGPLRQPEGSPPTPPDEGDGSVPPCEETRVVLIARSDDPAWSFASIAGQGHGSELRRTGDTVDGYTIEEIDWDRVRLSSGSGKRCEAILGAEVAQAPAAPRPPPPAGKLPSPRPGRERKLPVEIASGIHRISDTRIEVERPVLQEILSRQGELLGPLRAAPAGDGVRVDGIRSGTLLDFLGMKNGDQLRSINGISPTDTSRLVQEYPRLATAEQVSVSVVRGGKPMSIDVRIR